MELDSECNEVRRHAGAGGFFHSEVTGSIAPLACTVLALAWANSRWADDYFHLLHTPIGVSWGDASFRLSLHDWINDDLMAVFFFVVGIEIKRELVVGELSSAAKAALPVAAAAGGMLVPAVLFTAFNFGGPGAHGWGIPMATDIAFALGVLAMFGTRVPVGLKVFLTALAIAADKRGGGGGGGARAGGGGGAKQKPQVNNSKQDKRTNNVRNTSVNNVNNNVNVNKNVNVNVDDRGGCCGWDNDYHPVATAAAVTATVAVTSAVVGSIVNAPPPGCKPVNYGGIVYQQCGSTWYQPQGTQYVVINPPY